MMDKETKAKWLEALRSGYYDQAQGRLHIIRGTEHTFCCLGVLCEVLKLPFHQEAELRYSVRYKDDPSEEFGVFDRLPVATRERLGLSEEDESKLINLNDDGTSFLEIADHIEEYL